MSATETEAPKKKGKKKLFVILGGLIVVAGGVGGGLFATGMIGGAHAEASADDGKPKLVPKSEQKRGAPDKEGGGEGEKSESSGEGKPVPHGAGGEKYASNYYSFEHDFTSNLADSDRFIQLGVAISTPYDDTVLDNIKTNQIAVRSAVLMAMGDTTEEQVASEAGKRALQARLVKAINGVLEQKEGFGGVSNVYFTNFVVQ